MGEPGGREAYPSFILFYSPVPAQHISLAAFALACADVLGTRMRRCHGYLHASMPWVLELSLRRNSLDLTIT